MTRPTVRRPTHRARLRPTVDRLEPRALMAFAGSLDPTYGVGGIFSQSISPLHATGLSVVSSVAGESDGTVIEAGVSGQPGQTSFAIVHLFPNGTLDGAFGSGGEADVALPTGATAQPGNVGTPPPVALVIQPDGKLVLAATFIPAGSSTADDTIVTRFLANGTPDPAFGTNGQIILGPAGTAIGGATFRYAALEFDGKIVLAGTAPNPLSTNQSTAVALARLNANGQVDTTYGTNGLATVSGASQNTITGQNPASEFADGLAIQSNNQAVVSATFNIVVTGTGTSLQQPAEVFRLNTNGTQDTSLSQTGVQTSRVNQPIPEGLVLQANSQIVLAGAYTRLVGGVTVTDQIVARLNTDGSLNATSTLPSSLFPNGLSALNVNQSNNDVVVTGPGPVAPQAGYQGTTVKVFRLTPALTTDYTFGSAGVSTLTIPAPAPAAGGSNQFYPANTLAIIGFSQILVGGAVDTTLANTNIIPQTNVVARLNLTGTSAVPGDFTGDGISDPAVYLPAYREFAIQDSSGKTAGRIVPFGVAGPGGTIPAPGNYYGTGQEDVAAYLPAYGVYAIQDPTGQTAGMSILFGTPGPGGTIPAPGDYYGSGHDDIAIYLPASGAFAILDPTNAHPPKVVPFGPAGAGQSIPVPGDYYGTGQTDIAVYLPAAGVFAIQDPTGKTAGKIVPFGAAGIGNSIPMPGDYDGSGKTELAVYVPSQGAFYYRPANGGPDVRIQFGVPGPGQTLPMQGDYSGVGHTELGIYLPTYGVFAYQIPTGTGPSELFGVPGAGQTIPVTTTVLNPFPGSGGGSGSGSGSAHTLAVASILGEPDLLDFLPMEASKKKT